MSRLVDYRNLLNRLQHPVYKKDFSGPPGPDASFHLLFNHVVAKQMVKLSQIVDDLESNSHPVSLNESGINRWENDYFGFTKPSKGLVERRNELLIWINQKIGMSVRDVYNLAISITGQRPSVILNRSRGSWVLGRAALGTATILPGADTNENRFSYLVKFLHPVDSVLLAKLESELLRLEKVGSSHVIYAPSA